MKISRNRSALFALMLATSIHTTPAWAQGEYSDYLPEIHQQEDIFYLSGGIGKNETEALREVKEQYNLRITSADKTGEYRGDTRIVVSDIHGTVLLDTTSAGPLFYTNLPNGRYTVDGYSEGQRKRRTIKVVSGKHARVHFSW
jgi:hypothetical protein